MTTPILLPPLPALAESTVYMWVRHESGRYDSLPVDILALIRARDLEVARLLLEGAANFCTDEYHTGDGWGTTTYDRRCAAGILNLEVKHHE